MTTIPTIALKAPSLNRYLKQGGNNNLRTKTYNAMSTVGDYLTSIGGRSLSIFSFLGGLAGIVGGAVGSTFFKDNTSADWLSKIAMIGGLILSGKGIWDLIQSGKERDAVDLPDAHFKVSEPLETKLSNTVPWINSNLDPSLNISQHLTNNLSDSNLRQRAEEAFNLWTDAEFKNIINGYTGGAEITIDNGSGTNSPISLNNYKDRLAILIGYISGSTPSTPTATDFSNKLTTSIMKDDEVINGNCELFKLLPDEFNLVYSAARYYKKEHNSENSVQSEFGNLITELEPLKTNVQGPSNVGAWDKLRNFEKGFQNIKVLTRAIEYVLENETKEKDGTLDDASKRNMVIVRQSLVAGLGLRGNNKDEVITELKNILNKYQDASGTTRKGINDKLAELRGVYEKVKQNIDNGTYVCSVVNPVELCFNSIFPTDSDYVEFKEANNPAVALNQAPQP